MIEPVHLYVIGTISLLVMIKTMFTKVDIRNIVGYLVLIQRMYICITLASIWVIGGILLSKLA